MGELVAVKYWYSGWWFGTFFIYSHILGISSSQLIFIFLRGVGIPPTSIILIISIVNKMRFEEVHSVVRDHCWLLGWISRSPEKNGWIRPSIASNIYLLFSNRCFLFSYVFSPTPEGQRHRQSDIVGGLLRSQDWPRYSSVLLLLLLPLLLRWQAATPFPPVSCCCCSCSCYSGGRLRRLKSNHSQQQIPMAVKDGKVSKLRPKTA